MLCLVTSLVLAGCARTREVEKDLKLVDVHTGWYDVGIVDGNNKLVPSISMKLQNVSQESIASVQINAIFHRVNEKEAWGEHFVRAIGSDGLGPAASTANVVLRSNLGYTGTESRLTMLKNSQFVDATVEVFGKHGSRNWVRMGQFPVDRKLLTESVPLTTQTP